jgi:hypothetical protein
MELTCEHTIAEYFREVTFEGWIVDFVDGELLLG